MQWYAIEAYTSINKNNNSISQMYALEALKLLGKSIERAVLDGKDLTARSDMLKGSMLAGVAFANSPVAAVHALAYPIGGIFKIPHGLSNALILPYVLRYNQSDARASKAYADLCDHIWPSKGSKRGNQFKSSRFIDKLENFSSRVGLETRLRDVGPTESCRKLAEESETDQIARKQS